MFKVDLHTHSVGSPDGGLRESDYRKMLEIGGLDYVAITDHDSIAFASKMFAELGDMIIVGEEISAREGELIGLYLTEVIPGGLSAAETAARIRAQHGLVYLPHPFETVRSGLPVAVLDKIADRIDIVEVHNGRAIFQNKSAQAMDWAEKNNKVMAAGSDVHGPAGWGRTYNTVSVAPTRDNLMEILKTATFKTGIVGARGVLYPKLNRLKKKIIHD